MGVLGSRPRNPKSEKKKSIQSKYFFKFSLLFVFVDDEAATVVQQNSKTG
jgi:hypothetical protein